MRTGLIAATVAALATLTSASAETWPSRPITMIVPFTAGTSSDIIGRALVDHMSRVIGQPITVDNRGGAGGNIGASMVAKATPDGYTILLATTGQAATNKLMYKSMPFDPQKDFAPVALIGKAPIIIVARPDAPAKSLPELIAYAKANPDKLTVGLPGNGMLGHVTSELLQARSGIKFGQAQYRGSMPIINDLLGSHIDLGMDSMAAYVPQVKEGRLRALAIAADKRWPALPDVPTVSEAGLPGFEASVWYALLAPAGTPPEIVAKLNAAANDFLNTAQAKEMFEQLGVQPAGGTPQDLQAFIAAELAKWTPIVKGANITF